MSAAVVGVDPSDDAATEVTSRYRQKKVYPYFRKRGFVVTRLSGKKATQSVVGPAVSQTGVEYITGAGHGELDRYLGHAGAPIFVAGSTSADEVGSKIVHFMSCLTAITLGPEFVKNGTRAFFGYEDNFVFTPEVSEAPLHCDAEIDRGFADGLDADAVFLRAQAAYADQINLAIESGPEWLIGVLETNRASLCAPSRDERWGRKDAQLSAP